MGWCLLALLGLSAITLRADISKEYQIKAAFLYNFTKFVKDRTVNGRAILVTLIHTADEVPSVHLLFVPAGEETRLAPIAWQNAAVVVVGESERFTALGGTISFTREADKVRFAINLDSAERAGLKISAQLLKLATDVQHKSRPP